MPSLLIEWSSCRGGRLEFRYRNIPEIRARQPRSAGSRNYQIAFRIYLVSERILALPDATDRQQMHSAVVRWFRCGLDDEHVGVPGFVAGRIHLLPFDFGSAFGDCTDEGSSRPAVDRVSDGPHALVRVPSAITPGASWKPQGSGNPARDVAVII